MATSPMLQGGDNEASLSFIGTQEQTTPPGITNGRALRRKRADQIQHAAESSSTGRCRHLDTGRTARSRRVMIVAYKSNVILLLLTAVAILVAQTASQTAQTISVTNQQQPTFAASPESAESADNAQLQSQSTYPNVPFPVKEGGPNLCESTSGLPPVRYPTNWTQQVDVRNPRPAYPRPSMMRGNDTWMSLNGPWQFFGGDGSVPFNQALPRCILVPYPMESDLSGIGEHHPVAWYRRLVKLPDSWQGKRLLLHANRADWNASYFVNGNLVGNHLGGFDAHSFEISQFANFGGAWNEIIIRIEDPTENGGQLIGKQRIRWLNDADLQFEFAKRENPGKDVTPTAPIVSPPVSGPWSTVWIEATPAATYITSAEAFPNLDTWSVAFDVRGVADVRVNVWVTVRDAAGKQLGQQVQGLNSRSGLRLPFIAPWSPESPSLYYATISLEDPVGHAAASYDAVDIYFGFRKLELRNTTVVIPNTTIAVPHAQLNNDPTPYFWNGVLWQSYFSDGYFAGATDQQYMDFVYTVKAMGFNLLRVHGKVEDPQLYHAANTLGLAIMQDIPSACGIEAGSLDLHYMTCWTYERNVWDDERSQQFVAETTRIVRELRRNPALAMFTAYNEGWGQHNTPAITALIRKESPGTLVNGGSGWVHQGPNVDDVIDIHDYDTTFRGHFASPLVFPNVAPEQIIGKLPVLGEYGGTGMLVPGHYFNDNTTCRTYTSMFRGETYNVTGTDEAALREMLTYFQDGVAGLAAQGLVGITVYTGLSDQITECSGVWTWDFVVLKYSQPDFLVPLFKNVSDSFAKSFTFV